MNTNTKHWTSITAGILSFAGYATAANLGSEKYTYDTAGNIVEKKMGDQVTRFEYDGGKLKSTNRGLDYQYDNAGRLIGESREGHVERKLEYEFGDKVTQVEKHGIVTDFLYNAQGQLVGKNAGKEFEIFAWDGLGLVMRGPQASSNEEHSVGGAPLMIGEDVAVCDTIGTTLSVGHKSFESVASGESLENGLFTGKPFVEGLDSFVFNHRNYSPDNCRWTTADPSGFPDGPNNYLYACSNPVSNIDPTGLMTLGNPDPSPPTKNQQAPGTLKSMAYKAEMRDTRSVAEGLILGALNARLPAGQKYTVIKAGVEPGGSIAFSSYRASWGYDHATQTPETDPNSGGCYINIQFPSSADLPGYTSESIQTVYSNEPGPGAHAKKLTSYLDNDGTKIPFYTGVYNQSPNFHDNPSRPWKKGTSWTGDVTFVNYIHATKEIYMPPGATFKYSWDMKEQ